jgi:NTP pyrophosphatase (non-canonical NTP hydrolase)
MNLTDFSKQIHQANAEKGFWDNERNVGELLMLVVTELSEALEAHRKGRFAIGVDLISDYDFVLWFGINHKDTFEDEIADAIIRLLDLSGGLGIDIQRHIVLKIQYNRTRPTLHGKNY